MILGKNEGKSRRGVQEDELVREHHHSMDGNLSKLQEIVKDREAWSAQSMGHKELDMI